MKRIETTIVGMAAALVLVLVVPTTVMLKQRHRQYSKLSARYKPPAMKPCHMRNLFHCVYRSFMNLLQLWYYKVIYYFVQHRLEETSSTITLSGRRLTDSRLKAQGYTLNSAQVVGQGTPDDRYTWYIVMSK